MLSRTDYSYVDCLLGSVCLFFGAHIPSVIDSGLLAQAVVEAERQSILEAQISLWGNYYITPMEIFDLLGLCLQGLGVVIGVPAFLHLVNKKVKSWLKHRE